MRRHYFPPGINLSKTIHLLESPSRRRVRGMRSAIVLALFGLVACSGPAPSNDVADATTALPADAAPASSWDVPAGWRSELIPFPLAFAPDLAHHGVEEARFPPGVFDVFSTNYWAYAFAWRIDDPGPPDATAL